MPSIPIPNYPVIMVDVRADGSAHANVAGRHVDYPAGDIAETRAAVIAYAAELAQSMNRPVRMTTSGPDGTWKLAVHPNGIVTDLSSDKAKAKRQSRTVLVQSPPTASRPSATLTFSTGAVVHIRAATLIGRKPSATEQDTGELLTIDDDSRTISKTHLRLEWRDNQLWTTDLQSANGTIVERPGRNRLELTADQPHQLIAGDLVRLGEVTFTVSLGEVDQ